MEPERRVDHAEITGAEADEVAAIFKSGDANACPRQRLADEDVFAAPLEAAFGVDPPDLVPGVVPGVFDARWQGTQRGLPVSSGGCLAERFMRALAIVVAAERVKARLLFCLVGGRGRCCLRLQGPVHTFVPPVLLRAGWPDINRFYAELQKPHRQL